MMTGLLFSRTHMKLVENAEMYTTITYRLGYSVQIVG
jgi:hypothetical protein